MILLDLLSKGGPLMWLLLACSLLSIAIFLERFFLFHRSTIRAGEFLKGLANLIKKKNYAEALHECAGTPGPVARVVHSAIIRHELPRQDLKAVVQEAGQLEVPRLERYLPVLLTIAFIAPLIGLLGTVIGLVDTFVAFSSANGQTTAAQLGKGVYQSLITSAAGMVVAIPAYILYQYLVTAARTLMHDMERAGIEIVNILCDNRGPENIVEFRADAEEKAGSKGS
ncbi:MAG: MotA/TolQ/ExbB proton channel family protein [Verrucomicrobiota bacterium]